MALRHESAAGESCGPCSPEALTRTLYDSSHRNILDETRLKERIQALHEEAKKSTMGRHRGFKEEKVVAGLFRDSLRTEDAEFAAANEVCHGSSNRYHDYPIEWCLHFGRRGLLLTVGVDHIVTLWGMDSGTILSSYLLDMG